MKRRSLFTTFMLFVVGIKAWPRRQKQPVVPHKCVASCYSMGLSHTKIGPWRTGIHGTGIRVTDEMLKDIEASYLGWDGKFVEPK